MLSRSSDGLEAPLVQVEVHLGSGLPAFNIVGLPETVVRESKERVRSAILNSGFEFPAGRITVNLAPADLPKVGGRFDLPIAIGILAAASARCASAVDGRQEFYGELSLSGELRATPKLLPALVCGLTIGHELLIPQANARDSEMLDSSRVKTAGSLSEVWRHLKGELELPSILRHSALLATESAIELSAMKDLADVRGQRAAKRALEIAAAGAHSALMIGPPGAGKTMLAERLPSLLPRLDRAQAIEVACLASLGGVRRPRQFVPPFRQPQHTASVASMIGGGAQLRPGEFSLAHRGVLFLDELLEFSRDTLEALREPLETGAVVLSRAKRVVKYPADFLLTAAMNPCACGFFGDSRRDCRCTARQVQRYRSKLSGPLADRIDLHIPLPALPPEHLIDSSAPEAGSADAAARVARARHTQTQRQGKLNSRLAGNELFEFCALDAASRRLLSRAMTQLQFSARGYDRIRRIARTCADLEQCECIDVPHVAEAISWRTLDREGQAA